MYLSAYHFTGDPDALLVAHERLLGHYPPESLLLHAVFVGDDGITVLDGCPSKEVHQQFVISPDFLGTLTRCGLPDPRVETIGELAGGVTLAPDAVTA